MGDTLRPQEALLGLHQVEQALTAQNSRLTRGGGRRISRFSHAWLQVSIAAAARSGRSPRQQKNRSFQNPGRKVNESNSDFSPTTVVTKELVDQPEIIKAENGHRTVRISLAIAPIVNPSQTLIEFPLQIGHAILK